MAHDVGTSCSGSDVASAPQGQETREGVGGGGRGDGRGARGGDGGGGSGGRGGEGTWLDFLEESGPATEAAEEDELLYEYDAIK